MQSGCELSSATLPIEAVVDDVCSALRATPNLVIVAPPGAGKTTRLPLVFIEQDWCADGRLILVEPRRLAARAAAERMASLLGEPVGRRVGVRTRMDTRVSKATRIEVVTEGVFTRMILDDPALEGVMGVVFDEFHERALDADFGLALALDAQAGLRNDLRLVVMSATLDGARVSAILEDAPVIESAGRAFPVETRYVGRGRDQLFHRHAADVIKRAVSAETGDVLVFLPGQGEIRRVGDVLSDNGVGVDDGLDVLPLFGGLSFAEQARAIAPARSDVRRVILSTAIAETSLTIDGVRVVVDCGQSRVPRFDAGSGVTRLETVRVSRASADQRRGRAGRTGPGVCYRLWDEPETRALAAFDIPEILSSDLTGLVLDCAEWGVRLRDGLAWLDAPPEGLWSAAVEDLTAIGALDARGGLTDEGRRIRQLPLPPRLARMVLRAAGAGGGRGGAALRMATELAAILVERGLGGAHLDAMQRVRAFRSDKGARAGRMRQLARRWGEVAQRLAANDVAGDYEGMALLAEDLKPDAMCAVLLADAFPDRIAMATGGRDEAQGGRLRAGQGGAAPGVVPFTMVNGRGVVVSETDGLARSPFLVVADLQGQARSARVLLAAGMDRSMLMQVAGHRMVRGREAFFDVRAGGVVARDTERIGGLVLAVRPAAVEPGIETQAALARGAVVFGIGRLKWSSSQRQLRSRIAFLRLAELGADGAGEAVWPDLSDDALADDDATWLVPYLAGLTRLDQITADILGQALDMRVPWSLRQRLDAEAPTHFEAPTGSRVPIDYDGEGAPAISIRVQELFGLMTHPRIAGGRLGLTLRLLSPAHRPIQITHDLPGFWAGSWADVKAEMKGRYPKHPWPDDPAAADPTRRAKPRSS